MTFRLFHDTSKHNGQSNQHGPPIRAITCGQLESIIQDRGIMLYIEYTGQGPRNAILVTKDMRPSLRDAARESHILYERLPGIEVLNTIVARRSVALYHASRCI